MHCRSLLIAWGVAMALLAACGGGAAVEEDGPGPVAAPTAIELGAETVVLSTYAWNDQMPTMGDEPGPCAALCVNGTVEARSGEPLPEDLEVLDVLAIVDGEPESFAEQDLRGFVGPSAFEFVVRGGPVLEPGTTFDLAVQISLDGDQRWVRAEGVPVERTA